MKKALNVCLMNDSFPPTIDGVANTVVNYANIIQANYGNAIVATPEYPGVNDNYPYEVLRYPSLNTTKLVGYRCGVPFNLGALSELENKNIDIIHSHCPVSSTFLARMVRDSIHKPVIFTYHTKFDIDIKNASKSKLIQDVAIKALVKNIESCDDVWVVSNGAGENLRSLGYSKDYIVMPNGVDFDKGKSSQEEIDDVKATYHLNAPVPIYLFVGRMMWYKGIRIILDALKKKKDYGQDFRMLFVGDGMDCSEIKTYCQQLKLQDQCIFAGAIKDRKRLKAIFSSCDIFLFPSTFDTNGIVVREAAAAGLGTILIKGSCAAEDTVDQHNVIQIEENADSLAQVLIANGDNVDFYHRIGANAQNEIYMSWRESIDHAYDRYLEVSEKYVYDREKLIKEDSVEPFLAAFSDLSTGLTKAKDSREQILYKLHKVQNEIAASEQQKKEKLLLKAQEGKQKISETTSEAIGLLEDAIDEVKHIHDISKQKIKEIKDSINDDHDTYL